MTAIRGHWTSSPQTERVATVSAAPSAASARSDRCSPTVANASTGSFSTVDARSRAASTSSRSRYSLRNGDTAAAVSLPISAFSATSANAARSSSADGSVTAPASRCHESGWATRWSPSASDEPSTPNNRPRSPLSLRRAWLSSSQSRPTASASRTIARSASSASGARDSDHNSSTCASLFHPSRSRSAAAVGSTSPSRPTLGSFGRCVAGLATLMKVAQQLFRAFLQGQVGLQLERRHVAAVVLPLGALVAQEVVEYVLPQRFRDEFGVLHLGQRDTEAARQLLVAHRAALLRGEAPHVVLGLRAQHIPLLDAAQARRQEYRKGQIRVACRIGAAHLNATRRGFARGVHRHPHQRRAV